MQHSNPSFPPPPPPPPAEPPLPPGWEKAFDPSSGRPYYANRVTKETSWEPPLPPPPPPRFALPPPPPAKPPINNHVMQPNFQNQAPHQTYQSQHNSQNQYTQQPPQQFNPAFLPPQQFVPSFPPPGYPIPPAGQPQLPPQVQHAQINIPSKVGYKYSANTATQPGLLVPSVRAMIDAEYQNKTSTGEMPKIELDGLTAGAIADLCTVNAEFRARSAVIDKGDFAEEEYSGLPGLVIDETKAKPEEVNQYYLPLRPFELPVAARAPLIEAGRVDIRLHSLYTKLNRI